MRVPYAVRGFTLTGISLLVMVVTVSLTSCHRRTSLVIETGNPLRFVVSGPEAMSGFQISGPDLEREPNREGDGSRLPLLKVYWAVALPDGQERTLDQVGAIIYGTVPEGFVQVQPSSGAPPPLLERDLYNVRLSLKNGDGVNRFFAVRDGKVIAEGER